MWSRVGVASEAEGLLFLTTTILVLGVAVLGFNSTTDTAARITAVTPVGVTNVRLAVASSRRQGPLIFRYRLMTRYSLRPGVV